MTQWPSLAAFSMATSATASWPWPKDTLWSFPRSIVKPSFLPGNRCRPPPPCETSYYDAFFSEILVLSSQIIFMDFLLSGSFVSSWMLLEHSHSIVVTLLVIYSTSAFLKLWRCMSMYLCNCMESLHDSTQWFHILKWVHSRGEDEEHWRGRTTLPVGLCKFSLSALCVLHPKLLLHKIPMVGHAEEQKL